jgi:hypothetical protein
VLRSAILGCEGDYGPVFTRADFTSLAEQLARIAGRFILLHFTELTSAVGATYTRIVLGGSAVLSNRHAGSFCEYDPEIRFGDWPCTR